MLLFTQCTDIDSFDNLSIDIGDHLGVSITDISVLGADEVTISEETGKIVVMFPCGTDLSSIAPTLTLSEGATVTPESGAPVDFSRAKEYMVVNGNQFKKYTISAQVNCIPVGDNLIYNGGFDNEFGWTVISHNNSGNGLLTIADGVAIWDEAIDVPSGAWGNEAHMGMYQKIVVDEAGDYQLDLDITINGFEEVWFEAYVGTTEPIEGADYGAPAVKVLAANAWDCADTQKFYSGSLAATECQNLDGRISLEAGTYYVAIRSGGFTFGEGGIIVDNISMEKAQPEGVSIANGGFDNESGWTIISHNNSGNGLLTIADGVAIWDEAIDVPSGYWGDEAHMGMYQKIEVSEAGDYQLDLDITINGFDEVWFEVYVGTTEPIAGADYGDPAVKVLAANAWDCGDTQKFYSGSLAETGCQDLDGSISLTAGTYYVVIRSGGFTFGEGGIVVDNVSMDKIN
ncbi:MAG: hypothetical protein TRG1_3558 [Flavobacteriaceae bacterium FS1-H7996/R]|nr:MAG: hypothetical protein TRG1_3558 [Flavobacteriaceae bacterium FS1-H7996/R]